MSAIFGFQDGTESANPPFPFIKEKDRPGELPRETSYLGTSFSAVVRGDDVSNSRAILVSITFGSPGYSPGTLAVEEEETESTEARLATAVNAFPCSTTVRSVPEFIILEPPPISAQEL